MKSKQQGSILGSGGSGGSSILGGGSSGSGSILGGGSATQGGMLDTMTGSTSAMGYDAHHPSTLAPSSGATGSTGDAATDQAKGLLSRLTGPGGSSNNAATDQAKGLFSDASKGAQRTADSAGQTFQDAKAGAAHYAERATDQAADITANAQTTAHDATKSQPNGSGILGTIQDKVSGIFGGHSTQTQQGSMLDAGASSATKSTDMSEGIHEDAAKGIESVRGATTRRD